MNRVLILLVFAAIFAESVKKEKNIYSREANEGDFKHDDAKKLNQEDEIINEDETGEIVEENGQRILKIKLEEEKIDPKKSKEIMGVLKNLWVQLKDMFKKTFKTLVDAIPEIQAVIDNVKVEVVKVIEKASNDSGKNLKLVSTTITSILKEAMNEVGGYKKILAEKQKLTETPEPSNEITTSDDSNEAVRKITEEIGRMMGGGNVISEVIDDLPEKIGEILKKAQKKLNEELIKHENELKVDLKEVKDFCDKQLSEITTSLSASLKQTGTLLTMTMNTILTMVSTLKSQIK